MNVSHDRKLKREILLLISPTSISKYNLNLNISKYLFCFPFPPSFSFPASSLALPSLLLTASVVSVFFFFLFLAYFYIHSYMCIFHYLYNRFLKNNYLNWINIAKSYNSENCVNDFSLEQVLCCITYFYFGHSKRTLNPILHDDLVSFTFLCRLYRYFIVNCLL